MSQMQAEVVGRGVFDVDPWGLHNSIDPEPIDTSVEPEPNRFIVDRLPAFLVLPVLCGDRRGKKSKKKHGMSAGRKLHHKAHQLGPGRCY